MTEPAPHDPSPEGEAHPSAALPPPAPEDAEQKQTDKHDDALPVRGYNMLPVVGLGGSAGSIPALQRFFAAMPPDSGMAFVVILHLSPEHESILPEMLSQSTKMPVAQAEDGMELKPNEVSVIPPGKFLSAQDGKLRLAPLEPERGRRAAVDFFLRSLADTYGPHATAIILSGADGDGALGIKRIKERGGLTVTQDPDEAEHSSMPRTAIDTGMVDWVLPIADMPARLLEYRATEKRLQLPAEEGPELEGAPPTAADANESALREVVAYLRSRTGRDFSYYKRATVLRRVSRRMQVNGTPSIGEYLSFLRTHPGETGALQQDLLISVTNFFRDRDAFDALEQEVPALFAGKGAGDTIRVWIAGCATGEEAYSIAMLLLEQAGRMDAPPIIQVFATDLADDAIVTARDGLYPFSIAADVSEDRLRRFFVKEHRGYRTRRELRECILFAVHDLLKDAPFSRMDLVSCRNLLIYLRPEAQQRVFETVHFALRPEGRLFIGTSESVEENSQLFAPIDSKFGIYRQRPFPRHRLPMPIGPGTITRAVEAQERARGGPVIHGAAFRHLAEKQAQRDADEHNQHQVSWAELHFKLIERFAPPSLIVTRDYDIVHISENAGRFLHFSAGEPSVNLLNVVHPMLRLELRAALFRAAQSNTMAEIFRVPVEMDGKTLAVDISVTPAQEIALDYLLVVLSPRESVDPRELKTQRENEPLVRQLEREIEATKRRLRDVIEQYEASNEELKASNEELQAMNEELRSTAEELETSREELQSVNEELTSVNAEWKNKVHELERTNTDLSNLMAATGVATIFVDRSLAITRYTPTAVSLFRLIPTDLGRPLTDLTHRLNYPNLREDAELVLQELTPVKREVSDGSHWYLAQFQPYRTEDDRIAGIVISFIDVTESRVAAHRLRDAEERMRFAMDAARIYAWELDTATLRNKYAGDPEKVLGFSIPEDLQAMIKMIHHDDRGEISEKYSQAERGGGVFSAEFRLLNPHTGENVWVSSHGRFAQRGGEKRFVGITQNISDRKNVEDALRKTEVLIGLIFENAREYAIFSMDLERRITAWNSGAQRILGYTQQEAVGQPADIIFTQEDRDAKAPEHEAVTALYEGRAADERWHVRKDKTRFWGAGVMMAMRDDAGQPIGFVKIFRDQTAELRAKEALEKSRADLWAALQDTEQARKEAEAAGRAKDQFLAVLSHELRTPLTPVLVATRTLLRRQDLPAHVLEALEMIQRNVQLEAHFIDDLLDLTRISRGSLQLMLEEISLHGCINRAVEIARGDLKAKQQRLSVQLNAEVSSVAGDDRRLQQVFWNILKNASKFTPEHGEISIQSRNEPDAPGKPERIVVKVSDTGIGFSSEAGERIFDPFAQADDSIGSTFGGLGLGLAIAKTTIDAHGGTIRAESPGPGRGATFIITLPLTRERPLSSA